MDNEEENHCLIHVADRVAKHKDKSQQNCCDSGPHFGNINLFIAAGSFNCPDGLLSGLSCIEGHVQEYECEQKRIIGALCKISANDSH